MKENSFEIIPAIDILDGKCVRLTQGKYDLAEEFSSNPKEVAKRWADAGANRLHVVDLNGAKEGYPVNFKVIRNLARSVKIKVQVGGGVRTHKDIKDYLSEGVNYLILGTKAFMDPTFLKDSLKTFNEQIIIGLDLKSNKIAVSGWQETLDITMDTVVENLSNVRQIIYTDISKDGMLSGPNIKSIEKIAGLFKSNIIVSGGISSLNDIISVLNIKKQRHKNITGVVVGKSLYKGNIDLANAISVVEKELKLKI